jgi:LSD1 subclass zinc finger protein
MPVAVICPSCRAKLKAPDGLIGKTVKCPGCATPVLVRAVGAAVAPAPARVATTPRPVPKKPRPPEPEVLDEEPAEEMMDDIEDEEVEARPKKKSKAKQRADEEPDEEALDDIEDEEVEARPKKKKSKGEKRSAKSGDTNESERTTASFVHFATLIPSFGHLIALLLWIMKRKESAFVDHHGKTWLNFHLSLFVMALGLAMLGVGLGIGLSFVNRWLGLIVVALMGLTALALSLYALVMTIVAGMKAKNGEWFEYRCLFRLFK